MTHLRFFCNAKSLLLWVLLLGSLGLQAQLAGVENLAAGQPVDASGPLWTGFDASGLADGNPATFAHPLDDSGLLGFYFEVDLGKTYRLEQILIRNRGDGCCPERLSHYGVEIYADNGGETGALNWSALIRADGSNSGVNGVDRVSGDLHKAGTFGAIKPNNDFDPDNGKWGAWELGLKYEEYKVDNMQVNAVALGTRAQGSLSCASGGTANTVALINACESKSKTYTAGIKWILNPNARVLANYSRTSFGNEWEHFDLNDAKLMKHEDIVMVRTQFAF